MGLLKSITRIIRRSVDEVSEKQSELDCEALESKARSRKEPQEVDRLVKREVLARQRQQLLQLNVMSISATSLVIIFMFAVLSWVTARRQCRRKWTRWARLPNNSKEESHYESVVSTLLSSMISSRSSQIHSVSRRVQ